MDLSTYLADNLAKDKISIFWATPLDGSHQQVTESVHRVRQFIQKMKAAGQHGISESMQLRWIQWFSFHEALQTASLFFLCPFPGSPVLLLTPTCSLLKQTLT